MNSEPPLLLSAPAVRPEKVAEFSLPRLHQDSSQAKGSPNLFFWVTLSLGLFTFVSLLASHHIADWDLWAKLALGAHVWHFGALPHHDLFAFTAVLPQYVDHEWGAGTIFFAFLKWFGPASLMGLKISLACGGMLVALLIGHRAGCGWPALLLLAIPSAGCLLFGYVPVIRSHAFTFFFFAVVLFCLEEVMRGTDDCRRRRKDTPTRNSPKSKVQSPKPLVLKRRPNLRLTRLWTLDLGLWTSVIGVSLRRLLQWPVFMILGTMFVWVNVHGGFVAGLGTIAIYAVISQFVSPYPLLRGEGRGEGWLARFKMSPSVTAKSNQSTILLLLSCACLAITCLNPYGIKFWSYLLPAVMAKRPMIREWQPLPLFASDFFLVFRVLFLAVVCCLILGWKGVQKKSWPGLIMLGVTAFLAWRSRRHVPFFGIAALAFAGPYLQAALARLSSRSAEFHSAVSPTSSRPRQDYSVNGSGRSAEYNSAIQQSETLRYDQKSAAWLPAAVAGFYVLLAAYAAMVWLPQASFQVLAPIGDDPVREADILTQAHAEGNLATPFDWGSYAAWRLHPKVKISIDGRYEAAYPESTFQLNTSFHAKRGVDWDQLIRKYPVDYVILDLQHDRLQPADLKPYGYVLIWETPGLSALLALEKHAPKLLDAARNLPDSTINPLDASLTEKWWR